MKLINAVSLTALMALAVTGCSSLMSDNTPAPVDTMSVNGQTVTTSTTTNPGTTVAGTTVSNNVNAMTSGMLSGSVGKTMDDTDNRRVNQTLESSKTGQTTTWTNSNSNATYTMTPTRTFTSPTGEPCRDFTASALINGQAQQVYSTACRDQSGQWHIVSS